MPLISPATVDALVRATAELVPPGPGTAPASPVDAIVPLVALLLGLAELSEPAVDVGPPEAIGRVEQGPDAAFILLRRQQSSSSPIGPLTLTELLTVPVKRLSGQWYVVTPGGDSDLQTVRRIGMVADELTTTRTVVMPDPSPASLRVLSLSPSPGNDLTRDSVIVADLAYAIEQFEAGRFFVTVRFRTTRSGITRMGRVQPQLVQPTGRVTLSYPVQEMWDDSDIERPFDVTFCINQAAATSGASTTAACSGPVTFTPAAPAAR